jgi:hypothetical protein
MMWSAPAGLYSIRRVGSAAYLDKRVERALLKWWLVNKMHKIMSGGNPGYPADSCPAIYFASSGYF